MVMRYTVGMDFNGGSPVVEDEKGVQFYPRDELTYKRWEFVKAEAYDKLEAANILTESTFKDLIRARDAASDRAKLAEEILAKYHKLNCL